MLAEMGLRAGSETFVPICPHRDVIAGCEGPAIILAELTDALEVLSVGDVADHASGALETDPSRSPQIDGIELPTGAIRIVKAAIRSERRGQAISLSLRHQVLFGCF